MTILIFGSFHRERRKSPAFSFVSEIRLRSFAA